MNIENIGARELKLYIENDGELYESKTKYIQDNLRRKFKAGKYDHAKAPKLWGYLVENGAKKYHKEFGTPTQKWCNLFRPAERLEVSRAMADEWFTEMKLEVGQ